MNFLRQNNQIWIIWSCNDKHKPFSNPNDILLFIKYLNQQIGINQQKATNYAMEIKNEFQNNIDLQEGEGIQVPNELNQILINYMDPNDEKDIYTIK